jgi:protein involved in polysaccharide export with SLBB domain
VCGIALAAIALIFFYDTTRAQDQRPMPTAASGLGQENMSLVAAAPAEIKTVLIKDAGLMVELKRWVAKDATDHGQIIGEADLTDDAILNRIETDVTFRSVATQLLQHYGYLGPKVNPDSAAGKEQELLIQERAKWIAQEEEETRTQEHQRTDPDLQQARACGQTNGSGCAGRQQQTGSAGQANEQSSRQGEQGGRPGSAPMDAPGLPPSEMNPNQQNQPIVPSENGNRLQQAHLIQRGGDSGGLLSEQSLGGSTGSEQPFSNQGPGQGSDQSDISGLGSGLAPFPQQAGGFGSIDSSAGSNLGGVLDTGDVGFSDGQHQGGSQNYFSNYAAGSLVIPSQNPNRHYQTTATIEPVMMRAPNPYNDIPSLYDMYLQASPRPSAPKRFGSDVFENGTRDPQLIPMDLPAGPDYVVGPGDGLAINLWGSVSRRINSTVDREGRVSLPEVGPVEVSGKSLADVQQNVQQVLRTQFRDESVDVSLARLRTIRVYEVGDVENPGAYDISSLSTPLNALFAAGGPTTRGSLRIVKHYRGNHLVEAVDLYDLLLHGVKANIQPLENGDTVLVPPVGAQVTVEGMVRRPAIYELKEEKTLGSVLELAGGLLPMATLRHIEVQRLVAHDKQTMLSLDIPETDDNAAVTQKLESFEIQDGDRIRIYPIAPYNQDAVYLEGHVIRPGRYSYRADMRVTDLIGSYKELLPEPATEYAEIIRLNAPDFHPSVESFDLADAFQNPAAAPVLHAMDTVRIFSRFDFENPPTVSVWGEVRAPGTYQASGQIHLSDAVHLAGGLAPDAQTEDAQVFRYLPDGKLKIFSVSLSDALAGDPAANIALDPRDRLLIHKNPDEAQPATVYVEGEVGKPGRYPLTTNMKVADLIEVGGGLKPSAYTQTADLMRYDFANQAQLNGQHEDIAISAALAGDSTANLPLKNGDVVTVRQLAGWNDLGASIQVQGEVKHAGTYGIRPGERLSSVLGRAGGFQPGAYPYGAVLQRVQVRELESGQQKEMILRVKDAQTDLDLLPETDAKQKQAKEAALAQYQTTLTELSSNPPVGRVAIRISSNLSNWANTPADVEVRAGDMLVIPKRPSYVMVAGQVFNPTAVSFRPGKSARWYLGQSGGPTQLANKKAIFVIRADGSVIGAKEDFWNGSSMSAVLQPGDTVIVPEKAIGGGPNWQNLFAAAQVASSVASTVFIALHY